MSILVSLSAVKDVYSPMHLRLRLVPGVQENFGLPVSTLGKKINLTYVFDK